MSKIFMRESDEPQAIMFSSNLHQSHDKTSLFVTEMLIHGRRGDCFVFQMLIVPSPEHEAKTDESKGDHEHS